MEELREKLIAPMPGTQRELTRLRFGVRGAGPKVYIQAALHADEPPGLLVAWHLRRRLAELEREARVRGEVVLLPIANPIGHAQRLLGRPVGRFELASGENFNRLFAQVAAQAWAQLRPQVDAGQVPDLASARGALREAARMVPATTELASLRRLLLLDAVDADVVLDLHCDNEAVMHLYTLPALWPAVAPLARLIGAELSLVADDSGGDPFDESCSLCWRQLNAAYQTHTGRAGPWHDACVATTLELRGERDVDEQLAVQDAEAILRYLGERGALDLDPGPLPPLRREPRALAASMPIPAPHGGLLVHRPVLGQEVSAGTVLAEIIDPLSGQRTPVVTPVAGFVYARESERIVPAGVRVAKVAGFEAVRSGPLLSA